MKVQLLQSSCDCIFRFLGLHREVYFFTGIRFANKRKLIVIKTSPHSKTMTFYYHSLQFCKYLRLCHFIHQQTIAHVDKVRNYASHKPQTGKYLTDYSMTIYSGGLSFRAGAACYFGVLFLQTM